MFSPLRTSGATEASQVCAIGERIFASHAEARSELFRYIAVFYNRVRLHGALGYQSTLEYETNLT